MSITVFLDTNTINSDSLTQLLGCRGKLTELSQYARLAIPQVVFDELVKHKKEHFDKVISTIRKGAITSYLPISDDDVQNLSFEEIIDQLVKRESIAYIIVRLTYSPDLFQKAYGLAIHNKPPFDAGSDKGFKDVCIAFSLDSYLKSIDDSEQVYLLTKDSRLSEYFSGNDLVRTVSDLGKLIASLKHDNRKELETANVDSVNADVSVTDDVDTSEEAAEVGKLHISNGAYLPIIEELCGSGSFAQTHDAISKLSNYKNDIDENSGLKILKAALENQQINWILQDSDVSEFYKVVFRRHGHRLNDNDYSDFVDIAQLPNKRMDKMGNVLFSESERRAYLAFVDDLIANLKSRDHFSSFETNPQEILTSLQRIASSSTLDPNVANWAALAKVFILGQFESSDNNADPGVLNDFIGLLGQSNNRKREAIVESVIARLGEIEETFDDIPF